MGKFTYSGPMSAATLDDGTDVILFPGREVSLPSDNAWVKGLVAQKFLTPVATAKPAPAPARTTTTATRQKTESPGSAQGEKEGK